MNVNCKAVENYLHEHIPISQVMAVSVDSLDESRVILSAPLAPNINHRNTAFGGSISTLAILSAWTFVHVKALIQKEFKRLMIRQDDQVKAIQNMVDTAIKNSIANLSTTNIYAQGDINMSGDRKIERDYVEGDKTDSSRNQNISGGTIDTIGAGAFSLGDISGTLANTINQLPNFDNEPNKKELKELLDQLQTAVLETELDKEEKAESLEQIQTIVSSLSNSQDGLVKKTVKTAMKLLRGTAAALPPTASMVTICNQLPDLIDKIF
ncbi:MAG: YiiD C-terminal domain-containing protein [Xenococcaceae cyanobacterium]